jgi:hypothetical protein
VGATSARIPLGPRRVVVAPEHRVHSGQMARPLGFEPRVHVTVEPQAHGHTTRARCQKRLESVGPGGASAFRPRICPRACMPFRSSSEDLLISRFVFMASPPRADEAPSVVASASEDHDVHSPGVRADGSPAVLAIVPSGVLGLEDGAGRYSVFAPIGRLESRRQRSPTGDAPLQPRSGQGLDRLGS